MEEKKSVSNDNQAMEICERYLEISDNIAETVNLKMKLYGRDLLLQLRLHPLSLQKPKSLPDMVVVKEKLYLHDITDTYSASGDKPTDATNCSASLKPQYCNMKHDYSLAPHYLHRMYPYGYSPHVYNGAYRSSSSKFRSSLHTYCNPLKKSCANNHCFKDFPVEECLWTKRCLTSEDVWNCYNSTHSKSKEHLEAVPKSRKKLVPIIDPATGKNVLEGVAHIHQENQDDANLVQENLELSENDTGDKYVRDYFYSPQVNEQTSLHVPNGIYGDSMTSQDKLYCDKKKGFEDPYEADFFDKSSEDTPNFEETLYDSKPTTNNNEEYSLDLKDETYISTDDSSTVQENLNEFVSITENVHGNCVNSKNLSKNADKITKNTEGKLSEIHDNCQLQTQKECNVPVYKESASKESDSTRDDLLQLKGKLLRQEQQKMAILQSFLRYKKYQLEEIARSLDEKRIDIANWECNLNRKAKRLHEKELWLESKSEILNNKATLLAEKEKVLSKEENSSCDGLSSKNMPNETNFAAKCNFSNISDTVWDEIHFKNKSRNDKSNGYTLFGCPAMNKVAEGSSSSYEKYQSETVSLDELQKNIVAIEKMHSSNESGDRNIENKAELLSTSSANKKDESDSIGPSKGRRYMPEHIKYWLNKRDKSAL